MTQNIFEKFTDDPAVYNMKHLKTQLFMALIKLIRDKGWNQAQAAEELNITKPRMSNLFKGYLDKFSVDALLQLLMRMGYKMDTNFNPEDAECPLVMNLKKGVV